MRKSLFYICLLFAGLVLMTGCKSKKVQRATFSDLYGEWQVVEIEGKAVTMEDKRPTLHLDVARLELTGFTGCNRLMGKIEHSEEYSNIIRFLNVATTRKACVDANVEREFLEAVNKVVRFESTTEIAPFTEIALFGADNAKLMVLKKQK